MGVKAIQFRCSVLVTVSISLLFVGVQLCFGASSMIGNHPTPISNIKNKGINSVDSSGDNTINSGFTSSNTVPKIAVLYSSCSIDKEFQLELLKSVFASLRDLDTNGDIFLPDFIELGCSGSVKMGPVEAAHRIWENASLNVISLLDESQLTQFASTYDKIVSSSPRRIAPVLRIFTPRVVDTDDKTNFPQQSVAVISVQMNKRALSMALLNRVSKVGINVLIPVLDSGDKFQARWLNMFEKEGRRMRKPIELTNPIFIDNPVHLKSFRLMLDEHGEINGGWQSNNNNSSHQKFGVLLLASNGSSRAMQIAAEKNHIQMKWFSPNILEHEEWAYSWKAGDAGERREHQENINVNGELRQNNDNNITVTGSSSSQQQPTFNAHFGLYTVNFVGSSRWDNPARRLMLREFTKYTGASPRILSSVLAYDSATLSINNIRRMDQQEPVVLGLSGEIEFDNQGSRKDGVYFGVSAVPELASPMATLLQPSTWILEDTISVKGKKYFTTNTMGGGWSGNEGRRFIIQEFQVATSSLLTGSELRALVNRTRVDVGCSEHIMNLITHDPFNQMPYNYYFKEENLPENLLIPNQHGFGITFLCFHGPSSFGNEDNMNVTEQPNKTSPPPNNNNDEPLTTTLQIACTPGTKISAPIQCFRSQVKLRQKRSPASETIPTQYQYGFGQVNDNSWNLPQNSKWSNPKEDTTNNHYYQQNYFPSSPYPSYNRRVDTSVSAAAAEVSTTPAAPTSKLPELRQILKAAKPFVGSCIGSTTGCAMCVLVLGRLPLGAVPAACTGPCFVGTFGSCGSLLGRVFSETTVICTELFRQGFMDPETFMADAEFGKQFHDQFPTTMQGYTLLATPLVEVMKTSPLVTRIVSYFATPWAHHMKFLAGRTNEPNIPGLLLHTIGFPICNLVGHIHSIYQQSPLSKSTFTTSLGSLFILLLAITILTLILTKFESRKQISKVPNTLRHYWKQLQNSILT